MNVCACSRSVLTAVWVINSPNCGVFLQLRWAERTLGGSSLDLFHARLWCVFVIYVCSICTCEGAGTRARGHHSITWQSEGRLRVWSSSSSLSDRGLCGWLLCTPCLLACKLERILLFLSPPTPRPLVWRTKSSRPWLHSEFKASLGNWDLNSKQNQNQGEQAVNKYSLFIWNSSINGCQCFHLPNHATSTAWFL